MIFTIRLRSSFKAEELSGLSALDALREAEQCKVKVSLRQDIGDRLGGVWHRPSVLCGEATEAYPCFKALFRGDHLGVEFAGLGHQNLLQQEGPQKASQRLQGHFPLPLSRTWEALIIDDSFVIAPHDRFQPKESSEVFSHLVQARRAYEKHSFPGAIDKDVVAEDLFKAAGAEVDSHDEVVSLGMILVRAPLVKRLGLSMLSLRVATLDGISTNLAHRLAGSWISVLLFRKGLSSIVKEFFAVGSFGAKEEKNVIVPLRRPVASELAMLASVVPLICSDVSAPFSQEVFAQTLRAEKEPLSAGRSVVCLRKCSGWMGIVKVTIQNLKMASEQF
jgi:hypothetical protein